MSAIAISYTGFTTNFTDHIDESRRRLDAFVETNQTKADNLLSELKTVQAEEQKSIDTLLRQLKSLQHERGAAATASSNDGGGGGVAEQRKKLEEKQNKLEQDVEMMRSKNRVDQAELDEILVEEAAVRKKADEVRAKREEIEMSRGVTIEDLTKGLLNYKYTGLSFVQGEKGALIFKFTRLDREDPNRPFTFTISLDEKNDYHLSNVNPPLDRTLTVGILNELNTDGKNGFNTFVVGMRKLFNKQLS